MTNNNSNLKKNSEYIKNMKMKIFIFLFSGFEKYNPVMIMFQIVLGLSEFKSNSLSPFYAFLGFGSYLHWQPLGVSGS